MIIDIERNQKQLKASHNILTIIIFVICHFPFLLTSFTYIFWIHNWHEWLKWKVKGFILKEKFSFAVVFLSFICGYLSCKVN